MCIYVASLLSRDETGKITHPMGYIQRFQLSLEAAAEIWRKGHYPYVPGSDFFLFLAIGTDHGKGRDMPYHAAYEWVRRCDAILIVNGLGVPGSHVNAEYVLAQGLKKIIYMSVDKIPEVDEEGDPFEI